MLPFLKTKLTLIILSVVVVLGLTGATAVLAAERHVGPFAQNTAAASDHGHGQSDHGTPPSHDQTQYHAQGLIQSVSLKAGEHSGTLVFLPDGASKSVMVQFTADTHVEIADDRTPSAGHGQPGAAGLEVGLHANIIGTLQKDGFVLATEIQANANGRAHQGGEMPTPGSGNDHTPTPHGTPIPGK